jgi:gamma-glutamyl-gamma-aminobutyrate hydrolase PuuD
MKQNDLILVDTPSYEYPFEGLGKITNDVRLFFEHPEQFKLMVLTGGEDVNPALYGHKNKLSHFNPRRDNRELQMFDQAQKYDIPIAGICRGMQMLCVLTGGTLFQHVNGHAIRGMHLIDGTTIKAPFDVTSLHHQMVNLNPSESEVLAWAMPRRSREYYGDGGEQVAAPVCEVEAAYFKGIRAVAVQYHPEMMYKDTAGYIYYRNIVEQLLAGKDISNEEATKDLNIFQRYVSQGG